MSDGDDFDELGDFDDDASLDDHESALVRQDLRDLKRFEQAFSAEGYRGVSVYCQDCEEEHYYPWDMLRQNLTSLLETGETPVHEPAFAPDPDQYVPWEYARGYVDALTDVGVHDREELTSCPRCSYDLSTVAQVNFCPRCGTPLVAARLRAALSQRGLEEEDVEAVLRAIGLPG